MCTNCMVFVHYSRSTKENNQNGGSPLVCGTHTIRCFRSLTNGFPNKWIDGIGFQEYQNCFELKCVMICYKVININV